MTDNECCKKCLYSTYNDFITNSVDKIICRRFPKELYKYKTDWCGEFKQRIKNGKE